MTHDDDTLHQGQEQLEERISGDMPHPAIERDLQAEKPRKKARRGFAAMSAEKQKEIASLGGKAAHAKGTAHEFSPEEAREAGRKGGQAAQRARQHVNH
ncbi:MAG: hypothetical protein NVS3B20_23020 [Polyangiales bacterium]